MDGGGRLAEPLTPTDPSRLFAGGTAERRRRAHHRLSAWKPQSPSRPAKVGPFARRLNDWSNAIEALNLPHGLGAAASALIICSSIAYGIIRGDHLAEVNASLEDARNSLGNAMGLHIVAVALSGQKQLSREDILAGAGVTDRSSLLFFDVGAARERLKNNPWISDASVQTLYPDRLQIGITEREAFALWQQNGRVFVISGDGTSLEPYTGQRFTNLPFVVGEGAETRAKEFLALLDRHPEIKREVRASVLVAQRRWNLHLRNGIDVRLPETDIERALDQFAALNRDDKLTSRDITAIDLRLPDRVTVQLSETAAHAREEVIKAKKTKNKGGSA